MSLIFPTAKKVRMSGVADPQTYVNLMARGLKLPPKAIISPVGTLAKVITAQGYWKKRFITPEIYCQNEADFCFVTGFGCGGPAAAMTAEEMIALGVKEVIFVGFAGSLQEEVEPGDIVLVTQSVCADGTSPHYTSKEMVRADKVLTARLADELKAEKLNFHTGINWSNDALFRETKAEIKHYQKNGVLTVDMETSALLAVCARRNVPCSAVYVASDYLGDGVWKTDFNNPLIWQNVRQLTQVCRQTLEK